ncbi:MAG: capsular polysaccharide biosynthesis protein [Paraglaciecola sp.]|nr:capsular polysaccharide biosynthesis protein [Paraglaciecola sp.]
MNDYLPLLPTDKLLCVSPALKRTPHLSTFLGANIVFQGRFSHDRSRGCKAVIAWGKKPSALKATALAKKLNLPVLRLEDGFLRSVELGIHSAPFSIVIDDGGIYYDASQPSRLEQLIKSPLDQQQINRAQALLLQWQQSRVSKYNHSREQAVPETPFVLVVDQTFGDAAIAFGQASAESFQQMLTSALAFDETATVVVKTHPDVFAGKKQGYFKPEQLSHPRITVLTSDIHAPALLEQATAIFCVTSQMGFEALLWQKPVYTFGMPFYAGWGLTHDALSAPERREPVSIEQLVYAALIAYPRYIDPETTQLCEVEHLLSWLALQRQQRQRLPAELFAVKPSRWKKPVLRRFTQGSRLTFVKDRNAIPEQAWELKWGSVIQQPNTVRVEDGFIRSVGLGADMVKPSSWVLDPVGMYYDATAPSALEALLVKARFTADELIRAAALRKRLVSQKVTKYNLGGSTWCRPANKKVILVPGQVESDASIRLGSPVLKTNLALLQAVRSANPDAYIVYKPHPDVLAGLRNAGAADSGPQTEYDELVTDQDMAHMFSQVDEVHTLTSLAGFEALLRGKTVTCYGQPFYAGWGLTNDMYPPTRRNIQRTLDELVAATLLRYPTYISRTTGYYTTPERVITELDLLRQQQPAKTPWWRIVFRKLLALKKF